MIEINVTNTQLNEVSSEGYVILCEQGKPLNQEQRAWCAPFFPLAQEVLDHARFVGSPSSSHVITAFKDNKPVYLIFVGYGTLDTKKEDRIEHYRRALGSAIRAAERYKLKSLAMPFLHAQYFDLDDAALAQETMIAVELASYYFDQFITDKKRHINQDYTITICAPTAHHDAINVGVEMGSHIGHAVNQARQWCDLPPCFLTPSHLAEQAVKIAHGHDNLSCKVLTGKECRDLGMGGVDAVSKGSAEDARFVIMEYKPNNKSVETVALVGKGVTFDSGGLSIKPANSMEDMKDDMAGAAAVIATMQALAHLKPKVNVVAITPIVENMPDGKAFRPGDIIGHYNGLTSEVRNTDAEGRLILADALSYVEKHYKPDAIIDIATLTGSCSAALGPFFAGLMSKHDEFSHNLIEAGKRSGDWLWPLPFHDDYRVGVKSDIADVCNTSKASYRAGAIMAGFFLAHFVDEKTPWIHVDIAGTSYNIPDRSYLRAVGGSGFGVRLFVDILMNWKSL